MKRIVFAIALLISTFGYTYGQCSSSDPSKCCGATTIGECPDIGCGGDSNLNLRKNITIIPDPAIVEDWQFNDMLYVLFPESWARR